jgi:hypothetical protein
VHIVTWHLNARIMKSEKTVIARQRLVKHVPAATNLRQMLICSNDSLKDKKTIVKHLKAVNSILFSRSYEGGQKRPEQN